jgi:diguanylate cyclase (GGDEF)-like protein/PAS domain S-box-containing protein
MDTNNPSIPADILLQAITSTNEGIIISDAQQPDMPIIYVNPGFERLTGYTKADIVGQNCRFLQRGDENQPEIDIIRRALKTGEHCHVLFRNYKKDGTLFWNELNLSPIKNTAGETTHFVGIQKDVTREHNYRERIAYLSQHDQLTDLLNRHGFYQKVKEFYSWADLTNHSFAVVVADLDKLKTINDNYGHSCGDQLLREYAETLKRSFQQNDLIARFGGDEFVMLTAIKNDNGKSTLLKKLDEIEKKLLNNHPEKVTHCTSTGVSFSADHRTRNIDHLIHLADKNMYEKKQAKKAELAPLQVSLGSLRVATCRATTAAAATFANADQLIQRSQTDNCINHASQHACVAKQSAYQVEVKEPNQTPVDATNKD